MYEYNTVRTALISCLRQHVSDDACAGVSREHHQIANVDASHVIGEGEAGGGGEGERGRDELCRVVHLSIRCLQERKPA